jgi:hypothetical protein
MSDKRLRAHGRRIPDCPLGTNPTTTHCRAKCPRYIRTEHYFVNYHDQPTDIICKQDKETKKA